MVRRLTRLDTQEVSFVRRAANKRTFAVLKAAEGAWTVGGKRGLPLDNSEGWDGAAAEAAARKAAGGDPSSPGFDWEKYGERFVLHDTGAREKLGGYKMPFVAPNGKASRAGLIAVRGALSGARGGLTAGGGAKSKAEAFVNAYLGEPTEKSLEGGAEMPKTLQLNDDLVAALQEPTANEDALVEKFAKSASPAAQDAMRVAVRGLLVAKDELGARGFAAFLKTLSDGEPDPNDETEEEKKRKAELKRKLRARYPAARAGDVPAVTKAAKNADEPHPFIDKDEDGECDLCGEGEDDKMHETGKTKRKAALPFQLPDAEDVAAVAADIPEVLPLFKAASEDADPVAAASLMAIMRQQARIEKAAAEATEERARRLRKEAEIEAGEYAHLIGVSKGELADLLVELDAGMSSRTIRKEDGKWEPIPTRIREILKAANGALQMASVFQQAGLDAGAPRGSVLEQVEKMADGLVQKSAETKAPISHAAAVARVLKMQPDLYPKYNAEKQAAARAAH